MKKKYIVKNSYDFDRIIKKNNIIKNKGFIIYKEQNDLKYDRYGISVGKKLGNAVYRNKMKRRIRSILDNIKKQNVNKESNDYIIILRSMSKDDSYQILKEKLEDLLIGKE